ncbi:alpha-hydroxy-acid oxidizing enzyme [Maritimibacter sp. 55A14]|uniref:alpha-hydroxy acid oxidase n=1 Tax=Maritimibacter sp. 55A14 TaxID=2174844 RepID=UPI000D61C903|nr:alpha-hydroxy acid oxidase [Maritimibacter sp. 55A14]PWE34075.1 alpha-hydroxy-acid oxidizing enzyme [Maritimibacter sp. 55A14]
MDLDQTYPALSDLAAACRRRVPHFVWEYLDSATGTESVKARNRAALDAVLFRPAILTGEATPRLETDLMGRSYARPFGVAPVGMAGLVHPGAEVALARASRAARMPYCLSTVATRLPEEIGPEAGEMGWFQLYTPRDHDIRRDILRRARAAGFHTLVLTADLPGPSRRERERRAQISFPARLTPRMLAQIALRPRWAMATLRHGIPRLKLMESYAPKAAGPAAPVAHIGYQLREAPDWDTLAEIRDEWQGALVVKGVLDPQDAPRLIAAGADAIWVSNHGGRQFDAAPASLDALPALRTAVGPDYPLLMDGGIASGLDIMRALALGADMVMLGRGFHYALGACGTAGAAHLVHLLTEDLTAGMVQIGARSRGDLAARLIVPAPA